MQGASDIFKGILRFTCVIALVMIGFAHRPVSAYPIEAQLPAYQLPDGTFASVCFADGDTEHHASKDFGCDACRLSAALIVPMPPCLNGRTIAFSPEVRVFERRQRLARALYPPSSGPRAPPFARSMFV